MTPQVRFSAPAACACLAAVENLTSGEVFGPGGMRLPGRGSVILGMPSPGGGGPGSSPADYKRANDYLHEITLESGGQYYRGDTIIGLSGAFRDLAEELRRQYSIGYYPPAGPVNQR